MKKRRAASAALRATRRCADGARAPRLPGPLVVTVAVGQVRRSPAGEAIVEHVATTVCRIRIPYVERRVLDTSKVERWPIVHQAPEQVVHAAVEHLKRQPRRRWKAKSFGKARRFVGQDERSYTRLLSDYGLPGCAGEGGFR